MQRSINRGCRLQSIRPFIVAASKDAALQKITQEAIDSCLADHVPVNVILVETFKEFPYRRVNKTIFYNGEFNYNHCLNLGLNYSTGDIQIMANNDIILKKVGQR